MSLCRYSSSISCQIITVQESPRSESLLGPRVSSLTDVVDSCINEHAKSSIGCSIKRNAVETARAVYNQINPSFQSVCKMPLSSALINVPELNIEEKKSKNEKRKEWRSIYRKSKYATQAEWDETDVIRYNTANLIY